MSIKFAANLNFLFTEIATSLAERIKLAHRAGFRAVEIPYTDSERDDVIKVRRDTGIEVCLINIALDTSNALKFGTASVPGSEQLFKKQLEQIALFAKELDCKKIHIMAGTLNGDFEEYLKTYTSNLKYSAEYLSKEGLIGLIEPINKYSVPSYFMNCYERASSIIRHINNKHLRLMMDIFHLQHIRGNITVALKEMSDIIGHIQIAQVPHRHEPNVSGELDFSYIFSTIKNIGYDDWIGCEYKPKTTTIEGLKWVSDYGFTL